MESIRNKVDKVVELVQDRNLGIKEAVDRVKYDLDGDEIYDIETGQTICTIDVATDKQIKDLLR